ncbi:MAG: anti-sigma regulatory factor [Gammaproteobacteria bacterium]|nr:anti-sigma regulatory factor [Gammaproteobacteria bacterium]
MAVARGARQLAERLGFSQVRAYHLATATSELATNLAVHAGGGMVRLRVIEDPEDAARLGIELRVEDHGPGIADLGLAMTEGYSTRARLGCGLPGASRLMDAFQIDSAVDQGTRIRAIKWRQPAPGRPTPGTTGSAGTGSGATAPSGKAPRRRAPARRGP